MSNPKGSLGSFTGPYISDPFARSQALLEPSLFRAHTGTARGGSASSLTLKYSASSNNGEYIGDTLRLPSGPGAVQERPVSAYDGGTKVATVSPGWRTNLIPRSEEFDNAAWTKQNVTITANDIAAPDGTLTADKITDDATNAMHREFQISVPVSAGEITVSCHVKAGTHTWFQVLGFDGTNSFSANFNVVTGALGSTGQCTSSIEALPNGWYRCSLHRTMLTGSGNAQFAMIPAGTSGEVASYIGTGTTLYLWGYQWGPTLGDYIKTEAAAITLPDATTGYEVEVGA